MVKSPLFPPSVKSEEIEEALQDLLGPFAGPQGLVITLRRHDEYEVLIERIRVLEADLQRKDREILQMSSYPVMYLSALDELRYAVKMLDSLGEDTSFVRSLKVRRHKSRA